MGLDMYLGKYHKAQLEKTTFNLEESNVFREYRNGYDLFNECPEVFKGIATEVTIVNEYYNLEKISNDFAKGKPLNISGSSSERIFFRNYEENISIDLSRETVIKKYILQKEEPVYIVEGDYEIAYWRKANQIRQWFVNHIKEFDPSDNGGYYRVTKELLIELINDCQTVVDNHSKADEVMPSSSGFFFGGTEYDEWYFDCLENTITKLLKVISETDWDNEIVFYTESW